VADACLAGSSGFGSSAGRKEEPSGRTTSEVPPGQQGGADHLGDVEALGAAAPCSPGPFHPGRNAGLESSDSSAVVEDLRKGEPFPGQGMEVRRAQATEAPGDARHGLPFAYPHPLSFVGMHPRDVQGELVIREDGSFLLAASGRLLKGLGNANPAAHVLG